jgi:hypothetical protein
MPRRKSFLEIASSRTMVSWWNGSLTAMCYWTISRCHYYCRLKSSISKLRHLSGGEEMAHVPPQRTVPIVFLLLCVSKGSGSSEKIPTPYTLKAPTAAIRVSFLVLCCTSVLECSANGLSLRHTGPGTATIAEALGSTSGDQDATWASIKGVLSMTLTLNILEQQ